MTIYTGRGDEGETDLRGDRVSKANPRIEVCGTIDEVNAIIGTVRPVVYEDVGDQLKEVQNHLHILQAELADPGAHSDTGPVVEDEHIERIEEWIDEHDVKPLNSFIVPGGSDDGSRLHHARTVCRRAERRTVALAESESETVRPSVLEYLNRLSDLLFTLARVVNKRDRTVEENPGY